MGFSFILPGPCIIRASMDDEWKPQPPLFSPSPPRLPHNDGPTRFGIMGDHWLSYRAHCARRLHGVGIPAYGLRKGRSAAALNAGVAGRLQPGRGGPALSATCSKQCVSTACRLTIAI